MPGLIADENIPTRVIRLLREAGYDVLTVAEAASLGVKNHELAELSLRIDRALLTRDADFTRLKRPLMERVKVVFVRMNESPPAMGKIVLKHIDECLRLLTTRNVVILDEEECHLM